MKNIILACFFDSVYVSIIMGLTRCYKTTAFVGSKSLCSCCIYSGGSWACFLDRLQFPQTGTYVDEIWNISDRPVEFVLCKMLQFVRQAMRSTRQSKDNRIQFHVARQWLVMWGGFLRPVSKWLFMTMSGFMFMTMDLYLSGFDHAFLSTHRSLYSTV